MDNPSLVGGAWERGKRDDGWEGPVDHTIYTFAIYDATWRFWFERACTVFRYTKGAFLETVRDFYQIQGTFSIEKKCLTPSTLTHEHSTSNPCHCG